MSDIISQAIALYTSAPNAANKGNFIPPLLKERGLGGEAVRAVGAVEAGATSLLILDAPWAR